MEKNGVDLSLQDLQDDPPLDVVLRSRINERDFFIEVDEEEPETVSILERALSRLSATY